MITAVIIQARMTSTRLPGKVLLPLGNTTVLGHVLARARQIKGLDKICCAVPIGEIHEPVAQEAKEHGALVYRGSEMHVLSRYDEAAQFLGADVIMRITSDCPLLDPAVCSQVLALHHAKGGDYTCNNLPPSWPHGYDCEVFTRAALTRARQEATLPDEIEHVSLWMRRHLAVTNLPNPRGNEYALRITLDTPEDYAFIKNYYEARISAKRAVNSLLPQD